MYNNPKTEAVELNGEHMMVDLGVSPGGPHDNLEAAPARKAANPLQGQIKM